MAEAEPRRSETGENVTHPELSVVVPVFNEDGNIGPLIDRLVPVLNGCVSSFEVIFVDDGSNDTTVDVIRARHLADPRIGAVSFSRNFGKEVAIAAGLDNARGDAVVIMDADLQHPPETISLFVEEWRKGFLNIYGQRVDREHDSPLRRKLSLQFYRMFASFGEMPLPEGAGDFRLLDRQVVDSLKAMGERARFSKGLYAWVGFKSVGVPFRVAERASGESKFSYRKLTRFALDGLMSFSTLPLKVWTYVGTAIAIFAMVMAFYFILQTIFVGVDVPGFASLIVSVMFFAGVQLMTLGIMGEYIGRIFAEVKRRPLYLVAERIGCGDAAPKDPLPPARHRV